MFINDSSYDKNVTISPEISCFPVLMIRRYLKDWTQITAVQTLLITIYSFIFFFGLLGNFGILYNIIKRQSYQLPANFFLANLAVAEIFQCFTSLPATPYHVFNPEWNWGEFLCKFFPTIQVVVVLESSLTLGLIAVDRYRNIVTIENRKLPLKSAVILICLTWFLVVLVALPETALNAVSDDEMFFRKKICEQLCGMPEGRDRRIYGTCLIFVQFLLPLLVMSLCYYRILVKVRKDMLVHGHAQQMFEVAAMARRRRVVRILIWMVFAFILSWFPLSLINWLMDFGLAPRFILLQGYFVQLVGHVLAMSSVIWIPLLYFWLSSSHLKDLKRQFSTKKLDMTFFPRSKSANNPLSQRVRYGCESVSVFLQERPSSREQSVAPSESRMKYEYVPSDPFLEFPPLEIEKE